MCYRIKSDINNPYGLCEFEVEWGRTMADTMLKSKVDKVLDGLPPDGQEELEQFLDFLADKYQVDQKRNIMVLGGIWEDTPLDVTDEEIRKLREDTSTQLMKRSDQILSHSVHISTIWL